MEEKQCSAVLMLLNEKLKDIFSLQSHYIFIPVL